VNKKNNSTKKQQYQLHSAEQARVGYLRQQVIFTAWRQNGALQYQCCSELGCCYQAHEQRQLKNFVVRFMSSFTKEFE